MVLLGTQNLCFGRDIGKINFKYALLYGVLKSSCIVMCWSVRNLIILLLALIKIGLMLKSKMNDIPCVLIILFVEVYVDYGRHVTCPRAPVPCGILI